MQRSLSWGTWWHYPYWQKGADTGSRSCRKEAHSAQPYSHLSLARVACPSTVWEPVSHLWEPVTWCRASACSLGPVRVPRWQEWHSPQSPEEWIWKMNLISRKAGLWKHTPPDTNLLEDVQEGKAAGIGTINDALGILETKAHHCRMDGRHRNAVGESCWKWSCWALKMMLWPLFATP